MKKISHSPLTCFEIIMFAAACATTHAATLTVTNIDDSGSGSLRQAILTANASAGLDAIEFNIPGAGVHTISVTNALPNITSPVVIDGYTQPGATPNPLANGNDANLFIELSGGGRNISGLVFTTGGTNCTVRGLVMNGFTGIGVIHFDYGAVVASSNVVEGCFIGTDTTGASAKGPTREGVRAVRSTGNRIGGVTPAARNIISAASTVGLRIAIDSSNNVVQGNFIGTDRTGTIALPHSGFGVSIETRSHNTLIGGPTAAARNIIVDGIAASGCNAHVIQGNFIGTDVTGTVSLGPPGFIYSGIRVGEGSNNTVGGTEPGAGNVISGNSQHGIHLSGAATTNAIQGNRIGTDITGRNALPNATAPSGHGILIQSARNIIGPGNIIAFNGNDGINMTVAGASNNQVTANSIFSNGATVQGLGIDRGPNGVTANDSGDTDTGANGLQNFPVLTNVIAGLAGVTVEGFLSSAPNTTYTIEFFANDICEPSGFCEGQAFLGSTNVTTDATGTNFFSVTLTTTEAACRFQASATAKDPHGNTSEFSPCRASTGSDSDGDGACDRDELI